MGKRYQERVRVVLPVRVLGTDSSGDAFNEVGHTLDVNAAGARLGKMAARVNLGDELILQYKSKRGRFLVRWIGPSSTAVEGQIGLECLDSGKQLWPITQPGSDCRKSSQDDFQAPLQQDPSRRVTERYACSGSVEIRGSRGQKGFVAKVSDLSTEGCRVLTLAGLPQDTPLVLLMRVAGVEIEVHGVVRNCLPGRGMGIQFTQFLSLADRERLHRLVGELRSSPTHAASSSTL